MPDEIRDAGKTVSTPEGDNEFTPDQPLQPSAVEDDVNGLQRWPSNSAMEYDNNGSSTEDDEQDPNRPKAFGASSTRSAPAKSFRAKRIDLADITPEQMLEVALSEARKGLAEGGIPIGAAIFTANGQLLGSGHNRRVQHGDPSAHGETDAFRNAGRQRSYRRLTMVTTLAPCWYCSGLIRQFGFARVVVGESRTFQGGIEWLRSLGIEVIDLDLQECVDLLTAYIQINPAVWNEDIGEE